MACLRYSINTKEVTSTFIPSGETKFFPVAAWYEMGRVVGKKKPCLGWMFIMRLNGLNLRLLILCGGAWRLV